MDGKLVFSQPSNGAGRLIFGAEGAEVIPPADFVLDDELLGLGTLTLISGAVLGVDADLPGLDCELELLWDANVSRGMRAEVRSTWEEGVAASCRVQSAWEQGVTARASVAAIWQDASALRGQVSTCWEESERKRAAVFTAWQEGIQERSQVAMHWEESERKRAAVFTAWQEGIQERSQVHSRFGDGRAIRAPVLSYWQEAMRPAPGVSARLPVDPAEQPCYDPATVGRLLFSELALGDGRLVFVCQRTGPAPVDTIFVPVRRYYMITNDVTLHLLDGTPLHAYTFGMSLDEGSWTWQWNATLHASMLPLVQTPSDGAPVEVLATVNGVPYRLLAEDPDSDRQFGSHRVGIKGRGRAALLDELYAPRTSFGNALERSAQQLMNDVLTVNGVPFGWTVDFGLTDWQVPGHIWSHQGYYMGALLDIAGAAGGYIQPHNTDQVVRVLPLYPSAPWAWASRTPDYELPADVIRQEGIAWKRRAAYDRVFVSGVGAWGTGNVKRAGTAGLQIAPGVSHPLITGLEAARQRGIAELGVSGNRAMVTLRLPVLATTGLIMPGKFVRYVDGSTTRIGLTRSIALDWERPRLRQAITVETLAL